jgi:hypothetical protein
MANLPSMRHFYFCCRCVRSPGACAGWSFDGETGDCTNIPQVAQGGTISGRTCATALPCAEYQGIVWVYPTPGAHPSTDTIVGKLLYGPATLCIQEDSLWRGVGGILLYCHIITILIINIVIIITPFSCLEARCVCRQAAVKAAKNLPLVGLAIVKMLPIIVCKLVTSGAWIASCSSHI